ncbi:MAG TPA: ubiquitin-like domain-containing protein, partial [Acidimicrobiia bacterium]
MRPVPSRPEPPVVRPSPARARPHDPDAWFPLPAMEALLEPDRLVDSGQTRAITVTEPVPVVEAPPEPPAARPAGARRRARGATARRTERAVRRRHVLLLALATAAVAAGGATVPRLVADTDVPDVSVRVDGKLLSVESDAETLRGLFRQEGISIAPGDRVVPALTTPVTDGMRARVYRAFDLNVAVDGITSTVRTSYLRVGALQRQLGLDPTAVAVFSAPDRLGAGALVQFRTRKEVTVNVDGASLTDITLGLTVADVLGDYAVELGPLDRVDPALETPIAPGMVVAVVRVNADTL